MNRCSDCTFYKKRKNKEFIYHACELTKESIASTWADRYTPLLTRWTDDCKFTQLFYPGIIALFHGDKR